MNIIPVKFVRVYITESSHLLNALVKFLQEEVKVRGISVFRAIKGYGETGTHDAGLIDFSLNLPLVIEFFDVEEKVTRALTYLNQIVKPEHIVFWDSQTNH